MYSNGAKQKITLPDNFFDFGTAGGQSESYNNSAPANQKYFLIFHPVFGAILQKRVPSHHLDVGKKIDFNLE